jgi:hypothetical protein
MARPMARPTVLALWLSGLAGAGCGSQGADNPASAASGVLTYATPTDEIHAFDLAAHRDRLLLAVGTEPDRMPSGEIVYVDTGDVGVADQLSIASADGTTHSAVIAPGTTVASLNPVASPDGKYIAMTYFPRGFAHTLAAENGSVFIDTAGRVVLNEPGLFDPAWVGDGRVVFAGTVDVPSGTSNADPTETTVAAGLFVSSDDGQSVVPIAGNFVSPQHPAVSKDGKWIAFVQAADVWIVGVDGLGREQVTTGDNLESHPTFSPDGGFIACQSYGLFGAGKPFGAIAVVPAHPGAPTKLDGTSPNFIVDANSRDIVSGGRITAVQHMAWR